MSHASLSKFAWTCLIVQIIFGILFTLLVRYDTSADAAYKDDNGQYVNQLGTNEELKENLEKYPEVLDINMMLIGGFGFLMTFLKKHGFSSLGLTIMIVVFCTEWSILLWGFTHINAQSYYINLSMMGALEAALTSAAVLITYGVVLGKLNPFQVLVMTLIESPLFVANAYLGYKVLGAIDVGGAIFIHTFGAYFGIAMAFVIRKKDFSRSGHLEGSTYVSDIFAVIGTVLLWIFWPSFNAILAHNDAYHRAILNTYLSLLGSTAMTFVISSFFGHGRKMDMVDLQNASLSGGVAVGAIADLMIQPYGAFLIGSLVGTISCLGYRKLTPYLYEKFQIHDTCGVNNLHGMPGIISGLLSVLFSWIASELIYGPSLYMIFSNAAPSKDDDLEWTRVHEMLNTIEAGEGRTMQTQALMQLSALIITLVVALVGGAFTGIVLEVKSLFHPLESHQAYNDVYYWGVPDENDGDEDAAAGDEIIQEKAKEYQMNTFSDLSATEVTLP